MKTILILFLLTYQLLAAEYNSLLLRAQATVFPKIMLLDKDISKKMSDELVTLSIVHNALNKEQAQDFKKLIDEEYKGMIGSHKFEVNTIDMNDKIQIDNSTSYYFFDLKEEQKRELLLKAKESKRICFVYDHKDFIENGLISLIIKEKTYIYLNKESIQEYDIKFVPIFYKIVKTK